MLVGKGHPQEYPLIDIRNTRMPVIAGPAAANGAAAFAA